MTSLIAETARRPLRSIAQMVATPLVPRDFMDLIDPLSSSRDLRGRIAAVTHETADAVTVRIRVGRGWRGHRAGQFVRIGIDVDGVRQWRTYSITSQADPKGRANRHIDITVKAVRDGVVSNYLVHEATASCVSTRTRNGIRSTSASRCGTRSMRCCSSTESRPMT